MSLNILVFMYPAANIYSLQKIRGQLLIKLIHTSLQTEFSNMYKSILLVFGYLTLPFLGAMKGNEERGGEDIYRLAILFKRFVFKFRNKLITSNFSH